MPEPVMMETYPQRSLRDYYYILFRHKWKMILFFLVVMIIVLAITFLSEEVYQAEARKVNAEVITPDDPLTGRWKIMLHADSSVLQLAETHFSFELVGPAGLQLPLVVHGLKESDTELPIPPVTEFGSYRIKGTVATTTVTGREILLDLPELFFNLVQPPEPPPSEEELAAVAAQKAAEEEAEEAPFVIIRVGVVGLDLDQPVGTVDPHLGALDAVFLIVALRVGFELRHDLDGRLVPGLDVDGPIERVDDHAPVTVERDGLADLARLPEGCSREDRDGQDEERSLQSGHGRSSTFPVL